MKKIVPHKISKEYSDYQKFCTVGNQSSDRSRNIQSCKVISKVALDFVWKYLAFLLNDVSKTFNFDRPYFHKQRFCYFLKTIRSIIGYTLIQAKLAFWQCRPPLFNLCFIEKYFIEKEVLKTTEKLETSHNKAIVGSGSKKSCWAYSKDLLTGKQKLFTELESSAMFISYCILNLVGFLIKRTENLNFGLFCEKCIS